MKAVQIKKFGEPEILEVVDIEKPKPSKDQVLIKVYASSLNPFDIKFSQGMMSNIKLPIVLGGDVAGVITEVGENVKGFQIGNKIYGSADALTGDSGAFAEFAVVNVENIAKMPGNLDFNQAASIVLTGSSAVQALLEHINLKAQQRILIHGGSGGIGSIAIQIAKYIGAYIVTTATGNGIDFVSKLGADKVIDYRVEKFEEVLNDFDAVFDTVGQDSFEKSFKVLRRGGVIVSMVAKDDKNLSGKYGVTSITQFTKVNSKNLNKLTQFIEDGIVKPYIDKIYTLDNIKEAFKAKEKDEILGKIVISIN